jgi:hypothetical protein
MSEPEQVRPEVVQVLFDALMDMDLGKLALLYEMGITQAERWQAEDLFLAAMLASMDHRSRRVETFEVLLADRSAARPLAATTTWAELFDDLTLERAARLRDLYDALPDGARAEYDRRYGRPDDA